MGQRAQRGRVYRRCGCTDGNGKQLGLWCVRLLEEAGHGSWTYCVDLAPEEGERRTRRRGGFATRAEAAREMKAVLDGELRGVYEDRRTTVASFLRQWLATKKEELAPNTYAGYEARVERDLIPAFGHYRLPDLRPQHIERWIAAQRKAKRGKVTVYRIVSTLRNALNAAVRAWGLRYSPAKHSVPPRPRAAERICWPPEQAAAFLQQGVEQYADQLTDLFEVMLGTGMRRGEVLTLHWSDVHLMDRKLFVRWTLAAIDNGKIHLREPKTEAGRAWISLSPRVMAALHRQAAIQKRHTAASIMIAENIPIAVISKTLRHSTIATTINLYGHLLKDSADQAVLALAQALDRAAAGQSPVPGPGEVLRRAA